MNRKKQEANEELIANAKKMITPELMAWIYSQFGISKNPGASILDEFMRIFVEFMAKNKSSTNNKDEVDYFFAALATLDKSPTKLLAFLVDAYKMPPNLMAEIVYSTLAVEERSEKTLMILTEYYSVTFDLEPVEAEAFIQKRMTNMVSTAVQLKFCKGCRPPKCVPGVV